MKAEQLGKIINRIVYLYGSVDVDTTDEQVNNIVRALPYDIGDLDYALSIYDKIGFYENEYGKTISIELSPEFRYEVAEFNDLENGFLHLRKIRKDKNEK